MRLLLLTSSLLLATLAGCTADDDPVLRIAYIQTDDALEPAKHPDRLAAAVQEMTGRETRVTIGFSTEAALQALNGRTADAAFVDGSAGWFGWQRFGLDTAAAFLESDGRTYYVASAWVLADSPYESMEDLRGKDSCHTGLLKSAGMFMPLGWMIRNGLVERVGPDEVTSIEPTAAAFFGEARIPPSDADPYGNYPGALRCLSEGLGDVAFIKDTTPATFCGPNVANRPSWCRDLSEYRPLVDFGRVPSHPVMVADMPAEKRADLVDALVGLTATDDGKALLRDVLGARGVVAIEGGSEAHLGEFADNIQYVPGMGKYVEGRIQK